MGILIKSPEQIAGIRESCILAGRTLNYLDQFVVPGTTTSFINRKCEEFMRDHGAIPATLNYRGYPAASCISVNDVICHGIPGPYELREGDIVNVDVTTILNKYYGDTSKMYEIGVVSDYAHKLVEATKECLKIGIAQCREGNFFGNIGYEINKYATSMGYSVVYEFCGHGVGLKFHEEPEVPHVAEKDSGKKMKAGMTFTVEPMINAGKARAKVDRKDNWTARTIDGKLSAQFEHTILVTTGSPEVMTDLSGEYKA